MNKWWMIGLCSGLAVVGTASNAQAQGFELGARLGYGIPMGKADGDSDLSDGISGMVPLQLDVGYRVVPEVSIGGYVMYGFGFTSDRVSNLCDDANNVFGVTASCSTHDVRLGIQAHYHFLPRQKTDPWVGLGFGYEWLSYAVDISSLGRSADSSATGSGFEFVNLQGGVDFKLAQGLGLGPFLSFSLGQYSSQSSSCSGNACVGPNSSGDITNKAAHQWLMLGIRGTFVVGDEQPEED